MRKLIILDYTSSAVHIFDVASDVQIDEEYLYRLGFRSKDCSWMEGNRMEIIYHGFTLT